MKRILRVFAAPLLLCGCCSFCVTGFGDRLAATGVDPKALGIPVTTFAVVPF